MVEAHPWTSRNATSAKKAPRSLAIIGDGAVACEMAHAWWALGTKAVTILSRNRRILDKYEPLVADRLAEVFKQRGVSIHNNVNVKEVKRIINSSTSKQENNRRILDKYEPLVADRLAEVFKQRGVSIHNNVNVKEVKRIINSSTSKQENNGGGSVQIILDYGNTISAEDLLVAVGRKPNTDKLGLETVGLRPEDWLDVDDTCLVNGVNGGGEWLYAVGDINHRALLTHIGKYQAAHVLQL